LLNIEYNTLNFKIINNKYIIKMMNGTVTYTVGLGTTGSTIEVDNFPVSTQPTPTTYNFMITVTDITPDDSTPCITYTAINVLGNYIYPDTGLVAYFYLNPGFYTVTVAIMDCGGTDYTQNIKSETVLITPDVCIHPLMDIFTVNGVKEIKDIIAGDLILDMNDNYIPVLFNIISGPTKQFYIIPKDSFDINEPNKDFLVHGDHPIIYNNK
jgi:hypothetical protein